MKVIFSIILGILSSLIQIVMYPLNLVVSTTLPDISEKVVEVSNNISTLFSSLTWGLGLLPTSVIVTLLFILSVEIARHTIFISSHVISLVFEVIRKIKFW